MFMQTAGCGPQCHPGRACINTGSQKLAAMQSTAVIEVAEMNAVQENMDCCWPNLTLNYR